MVDRLDEEKLETLRRWGVGLADDQRVELRAAGKAILILIEEIERLQVDLWHRRDSREPPPAEAAHESPVAAPPEETPSPRLELTLRERLGAAIPNLGIRSGKE